MKSFAYVLSVIVLVVGGLTTGCSDTAPSALQSESKVVSQPKIDLSVAVNVGNHTYIPLYLNAVMGGFNSEKKVITILTVLDAFEKAHPELKITNWHPFSYGSNVFGLWVDHEPRTK